MSVSGPKGEKGAGMTGAPGGQRCQEGENRTWLLTGLLPPVDGVSGPGAFAHVSC